MKIILKSIAFLTFLIIIISCSSDSGSGGGSTPCVPVTCLNGGVSTSNCGCTCPIGFTGTNCSTQVTPTKILITKITVKNFPNRKPDGLTWDNFVFTSYNSPDIFPFLTLGSTTLYQGDFMSDVISNGNNTDNFTWTPTTPIQIILINSQYTLNLYDSDVSGSEFMGGFNFTPYSSTGGFPGTLILSNSTSSYKFELSLTYVW